jgi:hypothetical protein
VQFGINAIERLKVAIAGDEPMGGKDDRHTSIPI